jgi:hypothetical protein
MQTTEKSRGATFFADISMDFLFWTGGGFSGIIFIYTVLHAIQLLNTVFVLGVGSGEQIL